ncbi:hypothetical protein BKA64DRAFT_703487 [Cadophora sp. MPI-SDFR-AT-0126]|nr:hypothetical protein BKA64DRAFT_703487 [Leotiomycetes sp. MPI-SDFR-AT-0126]
MASFANYPDSSISLSHQASPANPPAQRRSESATIPVINTCSYRQYLPFPRWAYCICSPTSYYSSLINSLHEPKIPIWHRSHLTISLAAISRAVDILWTDITERHPEYDNVSCVVIYTDSAAAVARLWPTLRSYSDESCLPGAVRRELQKQMRNDHGHMQEGEALTSDFLARGIERKVDLLEVEGVKVHIWFAWKKETIADAYEGAVKEVREGALVFEVWEKMKGFADKLSAKYEGLKYTCCRKTVRSLERSGDVC